MKQLEFNTLDKLNSCNPVKDLTSQAQAGIKSMQVDISDLGIPPHLVSPTFQQADADSYVVAMEGQPQGPFTVHQLNEMMRSGVISEESYVWKSGMSDWLMIKDCPNIIK